MLKQSLKYCLLATAAISLIACASRQPTLQQPPKTKLADLATPVANQQIDGEQSTDNALTVLYVYRLIIPLDSDLTEALATLSATSLATQAVNLNQANGLIVKLTSTQAYQQFIDNIPIPPQNPRTPDETPHAILDARVYRLTGTNRLIPLSVTPYINNKFTLNYTSPDKTTKPIILTKGRCRFLTKVTLLPNGQNHLEITPQHHLLKNTLMPRTPEQTIRDGTVFDDLTISTTLENNQLLILACDIPRPQVPQPAEPSVDQETTDNPEAQPPVQTSDDQEIPDSPEAQPPAQTTDEQDKQTSNDIPPEDLTPPVTIPDHIGAHWLLAEHYNQTIQMLLIFQIQNH